MGAATLSVDPANVVQSLVHTLLDVFDATRDLYNTLRDKEKRDFEKSLRSRGYTDSRRIDYADDETASDEGIVLDKAAVTKQFDIGLNDIGPQFAIGDVLSQTGLQSQIIALQSVIITTFLYGPTSPEPISRQLSTILAASREAGTTSVDILAAQYQRQIATRPIDIRSPNGRESSRGAAPYPVTTTHTSSATSTILTKSRNEPIAPFPAKDSIASFVERPKTQRTDTESTTFTGMSSEGAKSTPQTSYCLYALDLQRDPSRPLSASIIDSPSPYCPCCRRTLKLEPGRSWEIFKNDGRGERRFRIQNRFVAKCHRNNVDGGYACVLCSSSPSMETICGDVKALIRHVWMDHSVSELEEEKDILEPVEDTRRRRDSLMSFTEPRRSDSRRSISVGPRRGK